MIRKTVHPAGPAPASAPEVGVRSQGRVNITLADVARVAGISTITASRALNNPNLVTSETRRRVREAAASVGYVPHLAAGSLRSNRTRLIACLVPTIASGSAFLVAVHAMTEAFTAAGYQVMLGERGYDTSREEQLVEAVVARRPDGIVVTGVMQSEAARLRLRNAGVPIVETWDMTETPIDMVVGFSHIQAGTAIAEYLHAKGYKRVGMVTNREPRGEKRAQGFRDTARRLRLVAPGADVPTFTMEAPSRMKHGREGLAHLLDAHPELDAVYCASDLVALGALIEARARGLDVPGRIAVVGFGDLDFALHTDPPLSTVHVDGEAIGRQAAACIIDRLAGAPVLPAVRDLGFAMVARESA
ncbi:MAG: LacI family DNA-binding transcriptional regulator [Rhodoferax sp.]|nr:LacI family DNA-binding transcriptional regulator [Rhodoferax sp.]